MYLNDLQLYTKGKYKNTREEQHLLIKELEQNRYLMSYWENLRDLFCMEIPDKFDLLDISKFNILLGEFKGEQFELPEKNGISTYKRSDFNFEEFSQLTELEKNEQSLFFIEDSIIDICERHQLPIETIGIIRNIATSIRSENFEHFRIHKKTTKWNPSRKLRAITTLHHKKGGINADIEIVDKNGKVVVRENIIENQLWENVWFVLWKGYWDGASFIIENHLGEQFFQIQSPQ